MPPGTVRNRAYRTQFGGGSPYRQFLFVTKAVSLGSVSFATFKLEQNFQINIGYLPDVFRKIKTQQFISCRPGVGCLRCYTAHPGRLGWGYLFHIIRIPLDLERSSSRWTAYYHFFCAD